MLIARDLLISSLEHRWVGGQVLRPIRLSLSRAQFKAGQTTGPAGRSGRWRAGLWMEPEPSTYAPDIEDKLGLASINSRDLAPTLNWKASWRHDNDRVELRRQCCLLWAAAEGTNNALHVSQRTPRPSFVLDQPG